MMSVVVQGCACMGREVELKLELDGDASMLAALFGEGRAKRLDATYFDTTEQALRGMDASLRLRRSGGEMVQTLKLGHALLDRVEFEAVVAGERPDPAAFDGAPGAEIPWDSVSPAFAVGVERRTWEVCRGDAVVEVTLDEGAVRAGEAEWQLREVELELRAGTVADLFALAREVADAAPVRMGVLTKAERGYRLAAGEQGRAVKAEPVRLDPGMTAADAFAAIVWACLRHYRLNEPTIISARDGAALHQARVALRRLRSAFSLFGKMLEGPEIAPFRERLKALAGTLGEARDLDVLLERMPADNPTRGALQAERDRAYDRVLAVLDMAETRRLMLELAAWAESRSYAGEALRAPAVDVAGDLLQRYRQRVKKRGKRLASLSEHDRHQVRIEGKKLRYAVDFFAGLFEGEKARRRRKAFLKPLEAMQEALGKLNDIATGEVLAGRLSRLGIEIPAAAHIDRKPLLTAAAEARNDLVDAKRFWR